MQETWEMRLQSLGQEDPLEEGMATHSSIFAWRIPWTEEAGRLQSTGSQKSQRGLKWLSMQRCLRIGGLPLSLPMPKAWISKEGLQHRSRWKDLNFFCNRQKLRLNNFKMIQSSGNILSTTECVIFCAYRHCQPQSDCLGTNQRGRNDVGLFFGRGWGRGNLLRVIEARK